MSFHAVIRLALPACLCASWSTGTRAFRRPTTVANGVLLRVDIPGSNRVAVAANFRSQCREENFALGCVCRYVSRLLLGHSFGAFPAPSGTRSSASHCAPLRGLGSSQNKFENQGKQRRANFFRAPPRKQTFGTWEPGPLAKLRPL
jgi:hypothetical protein